MFVMIIVYSTLAPFMLPFGLLYFGIAYWFSKYLIVYVHRPTRGGGEAWPVIFNSCVIGLLIYQLTMIGIFTLYHFPAGGSVIVLPLLTLVFWYYTNQKFAAWAKYGALSDMPARNIPMGEVRQAYVQPSMIVDEFTRIDSTVALDTLEAADASSIIDLGLNADPRSVLLQSRHDLATYDDGDEY